jgi:hypothetical protein
MASSSTESTDIDIISLLKSTRFSRFPLFVKDTELAVAMEKASELKASTLRGYISNYTRERRPFSPPAKNAFKAAIDALVKDKISSGGIDQDEGRKIIAAVDSELDRMQITEESSGRMLPVHRTPAIDLNLSSSRATVAGNAAILLDNNSDFYSDFVEASEIGIVVGCVLNNAWIWELLDSVHDRFKKDEELLVSIACRENGIDFPTRKSKENTSADVKSPLQKALESIGFRSDRPQSENAARKKIQVYSHDSEDWMESNHSVWLRRGPKKDAAGNRMVGYAIGATTVTRNSELMVQSFYEKTGKRLFDESRLKFTLFG